MSAGLNSTRLGDAPRRLERTERRLRLATSWGPPVSRPQNHLEKELSENTQKILWRHRFTVSQAEWSSCWTWSYVLCSAAFLYLFFTSIVTSDKYVYIGYFYVFFYESQCPLLHPPVLHLSISHLSPPKVNLNKDMGPLIKKKRIKIWLSIMQNSFFFNNNNNNNDNECLVLALSSSGPNNVCL